MKKPHAVFALTLVLGAAMAGDAFAGGFLLTPVGGFVRGPRGFVAFSPLGIAGRRNPVYMPAAGYQALSYSQQVPLLVTGSSATYSSASSEAQGLTDTVQLIQAILQLTRGIGGVGGVGGGNQSNLAARVQSLEADVAALKMLMNLKTATSNSGGNGGKPGQFDPSTASALLQALSQQQAPVQQQAGASAQAQGAADGAPQQGVMAVPVSPEHVELLARQLLLQMKMRKVAAEAESVQIKDDATRLEEILDKLKAEAAALKD